MNLARRTLLSGLPLAAAGVSQPVLAATGRIGDLQAAIDEAARGGGVLNLPAGSFAASGLRIEAPLSLTGVPGFTRLVSSGAGTLLSIGAVAGVTISGLTFDGGDAPLTEDGGALVAARDAAGLAITGCSFVAAKASGLRLEGCSGRVAGNDFSGIARTALFARDSRGLEISANHLRDIGNNGIQVWSSEAAEDGTIITGNRIERVAATEGGTGQNGNGINVYKAGNVMVAGNRISDCVFSAIRNNSGSNCQITGNSISRTGEVAIYCEFGFEGAVVSGNLIEDVAFGISITNFNEGGRLAVCANNVVRNVKGGGTLEYTSAVGIAAEADAQVTGNVVENARGTGIGLGWGKYCRDLAATGNTVRDCGTGISFSLSEGAGPVMITGNRISGSVTASILGKDHKEAVTADLGLPGAGPPPRGLISGNLVS